MYGLYNFLFVFDQNLCNNCYHKYGRTKKPWNCVHEKLYAHGLCQNCYINKYNQVNFLFVNNIINHVFFLLLAKKKQSQ